MIICSLCKLNKHLLFPEYPQGVTCEFYLIKKWLFTFFFTIKSAVFLCLKHRQFLKAIITDNAFSNP